MPTIKLTKTVVDSATPENTDYELRDTITPGFLCKITPTGRKVFMLAYRTNSGERRKPAIGTFGALTVDQARTIAQDWLADVRRGKDPSADKAAGRKAMTMKQLCDMFIEDHSIPKNRPSTVRSNRGYIKRHILPAIGSKKARDVTRADVSDIMTKMKRKGTTANRVLSCLRKMFNLAELWGARDDGSNPCRHVPKYPEKGKTRLISNEELIRIFDYMALADEEGLEHPFLTLAVRLQFAFAGRMSEIVSLEWEWVDFVNRRVVWPDSKTGEISKPISEDAFFLLANAASSGLSRFVIPAIFNHDKPMSKDTYAKGWKRVLERSDVPHIGTHGIRHRATTEIANSGVPVKVGMQLTAHKTVTQFMRYVHTEDDPVREAAELVACRRRVVLRPVQGAAEGEAQRVRAIAVPLTVLASTNVTDPGRPSITKIGNYRPYRHRSGTDRPVPPGSKRAAEPSLAAAE